MPGALVLITLLFCVGYVCIAFEHQVGVDKAAAAILTGVLCWTAYIVAAPELVDPATLPAHFLQEHAGTAAAQLAQDWVGEQLLAHLADIAGILFFLLGAMTIVEVIDSHDGFGLLTQHISARRTVSLLWIIGFATFFLSAALDNLTTTIVMISLLRKLVREQADRLFFAGIIVIAANAGGAWSPIGDVTSTMLWIGGQISSAHLISEIFLPSVVCLGVPLLWLSLRLRGQSIAAPDTALGSNRGGSSHGQRRLVLALGIGGLLAVPLFKYLTHLPPFMGMLFSLGIMWVATEILQRDREAALASGNHILKVLQRIDTPSILFFLGILLAVAALQASGLLARAAGFLDAQVGDMNAIVFLIGLLSAVVDNVPLVAAVMGMYDLQAHPADSLMWEYLTFAAGTGGSCLIIGSAAGVAAMGMERIGFFWYMRHIGGLALLGYLAGSVVILAPEYF